MGHNHGRDIPLHSSSDHYGMCTPGGNCAQHLRILLDHTKLGQNFTLIDTNFFFLSFLSSMSVLNIHFSFAVITFDSMGLERTLKRSQGYIEVSLGSRWACSVSVFGASELLAEASWHVFDESSWEDNVSINKKEYNGKPELSINTKPVVEWRAKDQV